MLRPRRQRPLACRVVLRRSCGGVNVRAFVEEHLPSPSARVLEVGCGEGRLALALAKQGYRVRAIDPRAPEGEVFEAVSLEDFADPGPFDAVVASRSLHHIGDLHAAVDESGEQRLIDAGAIQATGFRYVGERAGKRRQDLGAAAGLVARIVEPMAPNFAALRRVSSNVERA